MARQQGVQLEGAREFRRALRRTGNDVRADLKSLHQDGARIVERQAEQLVPVRAGTLKGTIRSSTTQTKGVVRAGYARVPYAGPIHFGWRARNIEPQPFLYDAVDERRAEVLDAYWNQVTRVARRHGLDVRKSHRGA